MRYAYGITAGLLLAGSAITLATGGAVTAQTATPSGPAGSAAGLAPRGAPASFADLTEQLQPAVVNISTKQKVRVGTVFNPFTGERRSREREQQGGGSGFIITPDGLIVTNNHVIAGGPRGDVVDEVTVTLIDGKKYVAKIVGRDATSDIALLKVDDTDLPYVEMESSLKSRVGDWVIAIGNPLGLGSTVTAGIVSALQRNIGAGGAYDRFIQTDTAINPGNSGGPLFNLKGKVIGINNRLISPIGANIGVGFAIPAEEAQPVIDALRDGKQPERGFLGISISPVTEDIADALDIEKERGEFVQNVVEDEAGDKAGLKQGDIVLKVNGQDVTPDQTLSYLVANIKPGTKIPLNILREGKPMKLTATVGKRPSEEKLAKSNFNPDENKDFDDDKGGDDDAKVLRDALGIRVIPLTAEIKRDIGMGRNVKGVVVDVAGRGSAAQARIRRADVIVSSNYKPITSVAQLATAVREAKKNSKKALLLGVRRRGGRVQYTTVRIDG